MILRFGIQLGVWLFLAQSTGVFAGEHSQLPKRHELSWYVDEIRASVQENVERILSVPDSERTFENTIQVWDSLSGDLVTHLTAFALVSHTDSATYGTALHAIQELQALLAADLLPNTALWHALIAGAYRSLERKSLTTQQSQVMAAFLRNCLRSSPSLAAEDCNALIQLNDWCVSQQSVASHPVPSGCREGQLGQACEVRVLKVSAASDIALPHVARSAHAAAALCIQNLAEDERMELSQILQEGHPFFYQGGPVFVLRILQALGMPDCMCIASRCSLELDEAADHNAPVMPLVAICRDFRVTTEYSNEQLLVSIESERAAWYAAKAEYDVHGKASANDSGERSGRFGVGYEKEFDNGTKARVDVDARIDRNPDGETKKSVEASFSIKG